MLRVAARSGWPARPPPGLSIALLLLSFLVVPPGFGAVDPAGTPPRYEPVSIARGIAALNAGDAAGAETSFRDALAVNPASVQASGGLASVLLRQKRFDEACAALTAALVHAPGHRALRTLLARAYLGNRSFTKALALAQELVRENPGDAEALVVEGVALHGQRRYEEAARVLGQARVSPARQPEVDLYRASALSRAGHVEAARTLVDTVRQRATSPALAQVAEKMRTGLVERFAAPARTRGLVKVASQYDTNAVIAPTTNVFGLRSQAVASAGNLIQAQAIHDVVRKPDAVVTASYAFLQTLNYRIHEVDLQDHALTLSWLEEMKRPSGHRRRYGARMAYDELLVGGTAFLGRFIAQPFFSWIPDDRTSTTLSLRYMAKGFQNDARLDNTPESRDADNVLAGVTQSFASRDERTLGYVGYEEDRESASGSNFSYRGHKVIAGVGSRIRDTKLSFNLDAQYHVRDYDNVHTFFGVPRDDHELTASAILAYPLRKDRTLSLEYLRDRNVSNLALFDYARNVTSLATTWRF